MIGSIANNRFLQRVNPEITRALNETGAAASMRQMVDLDIAKNLVGWWHRDNVNTRFASPDTFVTSALDSSGGTNDATQTTEASQPKLVSDGMDFDGSNTLFPVGNVLGGLSEITIMIWAQCNVETGSTAADIQALVIKNFSAGNSSGQRSFNLHYDRRATSGGRINWAVLDSLGNVHIIIVAEASVLLGSGFNLITATYKSSTARMEVYVNNNIEGYTDDGATSMNSGTELLYIASGGDTRMLDGVCNDIRIFNSALTATEITAIYNQTKGAYGL